MMLIKPNIKDDKMIEFKPLHKEELRPLYQWFQEPTIKQQYAQGQTWSLKDVENKYLPRLTDLSNVPSWIIKLLALFSIIVYQSIIQKVFEKKAPYLKAIPPNHIAGIDLFIAAHENRGHRGNASLVDGE